jgi:SsrA-binding protein
VAEGQKTVATNRRARHDFDIEETFEAGIVLTGAEVKSLRAGRASLSDAFGRIRGGEAWVEGLHIPPYEHGSSQRSGYESKRPRKLLLHRREIDRLLGKIKERGLALVPLRLYFRRGMAKIELGVGKGKRQFEKRQSIAEKEQRREIERAVARRRRDR